MVQTKHPENVIVYNILIVLFLKLYLYFPKISSLAEKILEKSLCILNLNTDFLHLFSNLLILGKDAFPPPS